MIANSKLFAKKIFNFLGAFKPLKIKECDHQWVAYMGNEKCKVCGKIELIGKQSTWSDWSDTH